MLENTDSTALMNYRPPSVYQSFTGKFFTDQIFFTDLMLYATSHKRPYRYL